MRPLHDILAPVHRRLWVAGTIRGATIGLLVGMGVALLLSILRLTLMPGIHWSLPIAVAVAGVGVGLFCGVVRHRSLRTAARLVDRHYGLKDRSISALQFLAEEQPDSVRQLQIEEAQEHLQQVDPLDCVPLSGSLTHLRWAAGLAAAMLLTLFASSWFAPDVVAKSVLPLAQVQSNELRQTMLPELEELAEDPEIEKLIDQLEEKLEEMDSEALDESDLLATLSEMEQSLAEARESLQLELTDTTMKALASAIKPADEMKQAAEAIEAEKYDEASEKMEAVDPSKLGDKQRRAVADNLKKMVAKLQPGQQGQLSESITQLAEGLDSKNLSQCKQCLSKLASACKKQGQCKKIGQCMSCQLNRLAQCKGQCRGQCMSNKVAKSNSPSQKAGMGASGKPLGEQATEIDSVRQQEQLTGTQGEGPSESEILQAPEGQQQAARQYAAKYNKFRREAEAVLNSEPLPMGHRETVRTYFEAIRPNSETDAIEREAR